MRCEILCRIRGSILGVLESDVVDISNKIIDGRVSIYSNELVKDMGVWLVMPTKDARYEAIISEIRDGHATVYIKNDISDDKRRYLRVEINEIMPIMVEEGKRLNKEKSLISNISYGGIGFYSENVYGIGSEVILKLALVREYNFIGDIKYVKRESENRYYYGVEFRELKNEHDADVLFTFMRERLLKNGK